MTPLRDPRHIAADIERRLLPDYAVMLDKAAQAVQNYKSNMAQLEQVEHALQCIMPDLRSNQYNDYNTQRRYSMNGRDAGVFRSGELTISSYRGFSCDITLNDLSIDCAIKLLALLRDSGV